MAGLSKQAIIEYQEIYKKQYGKDISYDDAREQGTKLLRLFRLIYQPIPKSWLQPAIGSNFVLRNKILSLTVPKPFIAIQEAKVETDRIVARFKPEEKPDVAAQMLYLYQQNLTLRRGWDSNPR